MPGRKMLTERFKPSFYSTNLWYIWVSMFAFEPWHSLVEFKRYLLRFVHEITRINTLAGIDRTIYNQYDSIVLPAITWLQQQGVRFIMQTEVSDIDFITTCDGGFTAKTIHCRQQGKDETRLVAQDALVFATNGSITANSSFGSHSEAPQLNAQSDDGAWALWNRLAAKQHGFGNPQYFNNRIKESKWESFTVTNKGKLFFSLVEEFSSNTEGSGALITFKDSA
jgi:oleate hydratase